LLVFCIIVPEDLAMDTPLTDSQISKIRKQLSEGGKIDACKLHQDFTGSSLLEAKQFVESLSSVEPGESDIAEDCDEALIGQILDLLESGCKLDAVRLYRDRTDRSLMESKNFIEKLISEFEILEKSKSQSGCVGIILIFVVLGFILQSML
jgi:ribosomal protein L7/L12